MVKNKVAAPFRDAEFDILYGEGISAKATCSTWRYCTTSSRRAERWYSYSGERIEQGRENVRNFLKENKDTFSRIDAEIRKKLNIGATSAALRGSSGAVQRSRRSD